MSEYDWFGTLPTHAQEYVTGLQAIVRALAERDCPYRELDWPGTDKNACWFCGLTDDSGMYDDPSKDLNTLTNHEPACAWRRAKENEGAP